jgi:hypothetical protein
VEQLVRIREKRRRVDCGRPDVMFMRRPQGPLSQAPGMGDTITGEVLANLQDIMEFSEAFLDDAPSVTSLASGLGAIAKMVQYTACNIGGDDHFYCF